jgi:hypothetical protein
MSVCRTVFCGSFIIWSYSLFLSLWGGEANLTKSTNWKAPLDGVGFHLYLNLYRGQILGSNWDKGLKSFPLYYSVTSTNEFNSPLIGMKLVCNVTIYTETSSPRTLKILSAKFYVHEFGFSIGSTSLCFSLRRLCTFWLAYLFGSKIV